MVILKSNVIRKSFFEDEVKKKKEKFRKKKKRKKECKKINFGGTLINTFPMAINSD